jgi:uncharacterized protein (UPF0332 family)
MISQDERNSLIEYRLHQATDTTELAAFLIQSGKLNVSVNRIYYGMFYALSALALKYHFETSKHHQIIGWFNKEFIARGKADVKFGKIIRNAYQNRTRGDYDAFVDYKIDEVEKMHLEMIEFIREIERIIKEG